MSYGILPIATTKHPKRLKEVWKCEKAARYMIWLRISHPMACCHTSKMLLTIDYGKIKGRLPLKENWAKVFTATYCACFITKPASIYETHQPSESWLNTQPHCLQRQQSLLMKVERHHLMAVRHYSMSDLNQSFPWFFVEWQCFRES